MLCIDYYYQTVAGIFALLNDYRLANGKPSLGFINPLIYPNSGGFNDIKSGSNPGCKTQGGLLSFAVIIDDMLTK